MKNLRTAISVLLLFSLSLFSCKKDRNVNPENLIKGNWEEIDLNGLKRFLNFTKDNSFFLTIVLNDGSSIRFIGTYQIQGDRLKITTTEKLEQEQGKTVQPTPTHYKLYENATFSIAGDILNLNYTSYPADAPVDTPAKFRRLITIDEGGLTP